MSNTRFGDRYDRYTSSFSGTDMTVMFVFPSAAPVVVGTATTISYSIYRQLAHVRTMGRISSKGYARGGRTCAGSIIMTVLNQSFVENVRDRVKYLGDIRTLKPDELPPFDIVLSSANEFGQASSMVVYGASITDETKTLSVEDIFTENVFTFLARDIQHMKADKAKTLYSNRGTFRANDENIGKFQLNKLIANIEDAERKKRLEELRRREEARWKEPVLTNPGTPPSASRGRGNTTPSPPTGTPGEGLYGRIKIKVLGDMLGPTTPIAGLEVPLSGVSVSYNDPMGPGNVSMTTNSKGEVTFTSVKYDIHFEFSFIKTGYTPSRHTFIVKKTQGEANYTIRMKAASVSPIPNPDLFAAVASTKFEGTHRRNRGTDPKTSDPLKRIDIRGDNAPMIKVLDRAKRPLALLRVDWHYTIMNPNDARWYNWIYKGAWPSAKGFLESSMTDFNGLARMPMFAFGDLFKGAIVMITAKPLSRVQADNHAPQNLFKSWTFTKG